jgi:hypothetical protein
MIMKCDQYSPDLEAFRVLSAVRTGPSLEFAFRDRGQQIRRQAASIRCHSYHNQIVKEQADAAIFMASPAPKGGLGRPQGERANIAGKVRVVKGCYRVFPDLFLTCDFMIMKCKLTPTPLGQTVAESHLGRKAAIATQVAHFYKCSPYSPNT